MGFSYLDSKYKMYRLFVYQSGLDTVNVTFIPFQSSKITLRLLTEPKAHGTRHFCALHYVARPGFALISSSSCSTFILLLHISAVERGICINEFVLQLFYIREQAPIQSQILGRHGNAKEI